MRKKIGIGYEDYKEFIDNDMYYVDKTPLIRDILERGGKVTLFTRPRRFGKTLALSMLKTFFEKECGRDGKPVDNSRYFEGMKVMDAGEQVLSKMGKFPVINLSLKSAKQPDFRTAFRTLRDEIIYEFRRHSYLWETEVLPVKKREELIELQRSAGDDWLDDEENVEKEACRYAMALKILSEALKDYHGENVIILLDEYDIPLENAYFEGFYRQMVNFICSLFGSSLKTNDALEMAVIMGCLRISQDSLFTGLNHLEISSVYNNGYEEAFGFTQEETKAMLREYGMADWIPEAKEWYGGYLFGRTEIYNPWSVSNYVASVALKGMRTPQLFLVDTSSNKVIKDLVWQADSSVKEKLDILIGGGTIEKRIHEDITYDNVHESEDNLWNFLFSMGYMGMVSERSEENDIYLTMRIPNVEIDSIFKNHIRNWFEEQVKQTDRAALNKAVLEGDTEGMAAYVDSLLSKSISTFDSRESFYHGFFLSLLYGVPGYEAQSNREEGDGRPDVALYPLRPKDPAILFELKVRKKYNEMEDGLEEAFEQIREKRYEEGVLEDGYLGVKSYGVCFCKKSCIVGEFRR